MPSSLIDFLFLASLFVPAVMVIIGLMTVLVALIGNAWRLRARSNGHLPFPTEASQKVGHA